MLLLTEGAASLRRTICAPSDRQREEPILTTFTGPVSGSKARGYDSQFNLHDGAAPTFVEFTCFRSGVARPVAGVTDRMVRIRANSMPSSFVQADLGNSAVVLDRSGSARPII
jgi:hypothetical protein